MSDKSQELYNTDKNTWEKVRDGLKDIVNRIEKYFGKLSPDSLLGKQGARLVKQNQEILDRFLAGVRAASENAGYTEKSISNAETRQMARYGSPRGRFDAALTDKEWGILYSSTMKGNQRNSFRIGDDGIVLHGDKFSKVIYYEEVNGDIDVKAVYRVENYEYNIHDKSPNAFDAIIKMERNEIDESDARAILGNCELLFGSVFKKYNTHTGKYFKYSRSSYKGTRAN